MSVYLTEEEQIDQIKKFWNDYGNMIITAILIAVLVMTGWRLWSQHVTKIKTQASIAYEQLLTTQFKNDKTDMIAQGNRLIETYPKTPYAKLASLLLAKQAVEAKNSDEAIKRLEWVVSQKKDEILTQVALIRLGRIYLEKKSYQNALATLEKVDNKSYEGLALALKGDIYIAMKEKDNAEKAYKKALTLLPPSNIQAMIQMKLENIA